MSARSTTRWPQARRRHASYAAFVAHRVSGVVLTLFLPVHFLALSLALAGEARFDAFLSWTEQPLLKVVETLLVASLAVHLAAGIRLLAIDWLAVSGRGRSAIAVVFGTGVGAAALFALNA